MRAKRREARRRSALGGLLLGWLASMAPTVTAAESLGRDDFAVGRPIVAERPGSLQSVVLDYDVYRRSVEPGLADLRVFDAAGRPVPYAIRRRTPGKRPAPEVRPVPIFRLGPKSAGSDAAGATSATGDYRIDAELSESGAIVRVHRGDGGVPDDSDGRPAAWLLDTSAFRRAIVQLDVEVAPGGEFVSRMRLETSDDLARFSEVQADLALARLDQAGHRIERLRLEIPATRARYLRLSPRNGRLEAEILGVRAQLASKDPAPRRLRHRVEGRFDPDEPGIVHFDLDAAPPIESMRVLLASPQTIVEGRLESAASPEGPWRLRQSGVFYHFERGGTTLRNAKIRGSDPGHRHLRLVTSMRGGGLVGEPPSLELVWRPEQLLYIDRDAQPALLAIGRAGTRAGDFPARDLLRMAGRGPDPHVEPTAFLGPEQTLAGDGVLVLTKPVPWRTYGLWALLLGSVGIVLVLSLRLMQRAES